MYGHTGGYDTVTNGVHVNGGKRAMFLPLQGSCSCTSYVPQLATIAEQDPALIAIPIDAMYLPLLLTAWTMKILVSWQDLHRTEGIYGIQYAFAHQASSVCS